MSVSCNSSWDPESRIMAITDSSVVLLFLSISRVAGKDRGVPSAVRCTGASQPLATCHFPVVQNLSTQRVCLM